MFPTSYRYSGVPEMIEPSSFSHTFYEFFAGSGMVRAGLGHPWKCLFANDFDDKKARSYEDNWGDDEIVAKDINSVSSGELPSQADLAWASFPCQDLSLAGMGAGLRGSRSGTFWPFWTLIRELGREGRSPEMVVLENVCGALTSHDGEDFRSLIHALTTEGYRVGALVIDAALFVPHSRPRLFIVGTRINLHVDPALILEEPKKPFHTEGILAAHRGLSRADRASWIWWNLPVPPPRESTLASVVETAIPWHTVDQTQALLDLMSPLHIAKIEEAKRAGKVMVGTVYKRTRPDKRGRRAQRAEVRFDNLAGCLRTPGGGSSRQTIIVVEGNLVRSRLLSPREAARLMGLRDEYILPKSYNEAYRLMGDGVAVPVVRHLARYILEPLIEAAKSSVEDAA
jgi:DNA (cytosine-5)-methyltransferase 1